MNCSFRMSPFLQMFCFFQIAVFMTGVFPAVTPLGSAQVADAPDREMSTDPLPSGSAEEVKTDCACSTMNLVCATPEEFSICGSASACSSNAPDCAMILPLDTCRDLGLSSSGEKLPIPTEVSCTKDITFPSTDPEGIAKRAIECCTFKHEVIHLTDPMCLNSATKKTCMEAPAYDVSAACEFEVAEDFCTKYPFHKSCKEMCGGLILAQIYKIANQCVCDNQKPGVPPEDVNKICADQCKTFTPNMPSHCPVKLLNPDKVADSYCAKLFPTPKPTPKPTPTPVSSIEPDPTPSVTPEPTWPLETSTELPAE